MNIKKRSLKRRRSGSKLKSLLKKMSASAKKLFDENKDSIDIELIKPSEKGPHKGRITIKDLRKAMIID